MKQIKDEYNSNPFGVAPAQLRDVASIPINFEEAYYNSDLWCRNQWRNAIELELQKINELKVWTIIKRQDIPSKRKPIKNRWVFDIKRNGRFKARLVACGYSQVPGIDFQDYYAPVVNEVVFRILIILQLTYKLKAVIIDIETAFLHGDLQEDIYMMAPKGGDFKHDECVKLNKALYGLVQAARQFYIKFAKVLNKIGFIQSYADPCLFHRTTKKGRIIMVVHIDDCYVIGNPQEIQSFSEDLQKQGLKIKISDLAMDYLSCDIRMDYINNLAWIGQTTLLAKVEKKFGPLLTKLGNYEYKTPGTPNLVIARPTDDDPVLTPDQQHLYRSGVGTLLQFTNKTRPDLCNAVRELSKNMDRATPASFKEMLRIFKYLLQTKDYGLRIAPTIDSNTPIKWNLRVFSDSDWAADKTTRKSVTGFVILLNGTPILWRSQSQRSVALSSTEAEYYAMAEATKEIKFILQVLESLSIKTERPIIVNIDNVGAIFVAENASATKHTRHIEARYHFVREFIIDGHIKVIFVMSKENIADMFTKNVTSEIYKEHIDNFIIHRQIIELTSSELNKTATQFSDSGGVLESSWYPVPWDTEKDSVHWDAVNDSVYESLKLGVQNDSKGNYDPEKKLSTPDITPKVNDYLKGKYKYTTRSTEKLDPKGH